MSLQHDQLTRPATPWDPDTLICLDTVLDECKDWTEILDRRPHYVSAQPQFKTALVSLKSKLEIFLSDVDERTTKLLSPIRSEIDKLKPIIRAEGDMEHVDLAVLLEQLDEAVGKRPQRRDQDPAHAGLSKTSLDGSSNETLGDSEELSNQTWDLTSLASTARTAWSELVGSEMLCLGFRAKR